MNDSSPREVSNVPRIPRIPRVQVTSIIENGIFYGYRYQIQKDYEEYSSLFNPKREEYSSLFNPKRLMIDKPIMMEHLYKQAEKIGIDTEFLHVKAFQPEGWIPGLPNPIYCRDDIPPGQYIEFYTQYGETYEALVDYVSLGDNTVYLNGQSNIKIVNTHKLIQGVAYNNGSITSFTQIPNSQVGTKKRIILRFEKYGYVSMITVHPPSDVHDNRSTSYKFGRTSLTMINFKESNNYKPKTAYYHRLLVKLDKGDYKFFTLNDSYLGHKSKMEGMYQQGIMEYVDSMWNSTLDYSLCEGTITTTDKFLIESQGYFDDYGDEDKQEEYDITETKIFIDTGHKDGPSIKDDKLEWYLDGKITTSGNYIGAMINKRGILQSLFDPNIVKIINGYSRYKYRKYLLMLYNKTKDSDIGTLLSIYLE